MNLQIAGGAAGLVEAELGSIVRLTPSGAQQLAADLEYLCNVLSALGVEGSRTMPTWQVSGSEQWFTRVSHAY